MQDETATAEAPPEETPADTTDAVPEAPPATDEPEAGETPVHAVARRDRGALELEIKAVTDEFATGALTLGDGELLTPHRIANFIDKRTGKKPSPGAVAACLHRWLDVGYIVANEKPFAFADYTEAAVNDGLAALKAAASERKKAEKAATSTEEAVEEATEAVAEAVEEATEATEAAEEAAEAVADLAEQVTD